MVKKAMKAIKNSLAGEFVEKIKKFLLAEKDKLESKTGAMKAEGAMVAGDATAFPNYGDTEDDNAREVADYEANATMEEDAEKQLRDVKAALKRIDKGEYGTCKYCKKLIEEKRLLARPTSSACVECKKAIAQEA